MDVKSPESVLVIASDDTLRRSLAFLLEAEGYVVSSHDRMPLGLAPGEPRSRCVIVDEGSLDGAGTWERLAELADAIVVLLSRARELPPGRIHTVEKPLLGDDLVAAVEAALVRSPELRTIP